MQSNRSSLMTRDAWEHIIIASSTHDIENLSDVRGRNRVDDAVGVMYFKLVSI